MVQPLGRRWRSLEQTYCDVQVSIDAPQDLRALRGQRTYISASVISGIGASQNRTMRRATKHATPRYVHWTLCNPSVVSADVKKTRAARSGATNEPTPWTALYTISVSTHMRWPAQVEVHAYLGKIEPDFRIFGWTTDGEKTGHCQYFRARTSQMVLESSQACWRTHGSAAVSSVDSPIPTTNMDPQNPPKLFLTPDGQKSRQPTARTARPVMNVMRKPYRRRIQPEIVNGQRK